MPLSPYRFENPVTMKIGGVPLFSEYWQRELQSTRDAIANAQYAIASLQPLFALLGAGGDQEQAIQAIVGLALRGSVPTPASPSGPPALVTPSPTPENWPFPFRFQERQWSTFQAIRDTRANRTAAKYPPGAFRGDLYVETDAGSSLVYQSDGTNWVYVGGMYTANLASILTGLGTSDAKLLFEVSDYGHVLKWSGSVWGWGPNDDGSGYYRLCDTAPTTPGWQLADGSTVARLNADGTTTNVTVWDVTTARYLKGGHSNAGVANASGVTADADLNVTTVEVEAGTGEIVVDNVDNPHSHGPGSLELANAQGLLYYRR